MDWKGYISYSQGGIDGSPSYRYDMIPCPKYYVLRIL